MQTWTCINLSLSLWLSESYTITNLDNPEITLELFYQENLKFPHKPFPQDSKGAHWSKHEVNKACGTRFRSHSAGSQPENFTLMNFNASQICFLEKFKDNQICSKKKNIYFPKHLPFGTLSLPSSYWSNQSHQNLGLFTHFFIAQTLKHIISVGKREWRVLIQPCACDLNRENENSFLQEFHTKNYTQKLLWLNRNLFFNRITSSTLPSGSASSTSRII